MPAGGLSGTAICQASFERKVFVLSCNLSSNQKGSESAENQNLNAKESNFECKESNLTGEISEKLTVKLRQKDE
jgi:hypothetical protein